MHDTTEMCILDDILQSAWCEKRLLEFEVQKGKLLWAKGLYPTPTKLLRDLHQPETGRPIVLFVVRLRKMDPPFLVFIMVNFFKCFLLFFLLPFLFLPFVFVSRKSHQDTNLFGKSKRRRRKHVSTVSCHACANRVTVGCHVGWWCNHVMMSWQGQLPDDVGFEPLPRFTVDFAIPSPWAAAVTVCCWGRWIPPEDIAKFGEENHGGQAANMLQLCKRKLVIRDSILSFGFDVSQNCAAFWGMNYLLYALCVHQDVRRNAFERAWHVTWGIMWS